MKFKTYLRSKMKLNFKNIIMCICILAFLNTESLLSKGIEQKFKAIVDSIYNENIDAIGIMIHVESPNNKISWTYSVGYSDKDNNKLDKNQPFLIASNTKSYVAVAIMKLIESKKFKLNQSIENLLSIESKQKLLNNGYDLKSIKVINLLSHTSGIGDYVNDEYLEFINNNKNYNWTRNEQVSLAMKVNKPLFEAGSKFKYADLNYLLLTEIIEKFTNKPFYKAIRDLLGFKINNLNSTWFIDLEEKPKNILPLVHQYWSKYDWDSEKLNPSWDLYGGGGLASTTIDMALFYQYLFEGKIIKDKSLLSKLNEYILPKEESNYCIGFRNILFHGETGYYHGGFWGTDVMYLPKLNTTFSISTLSKDKRDLNADINFKILELLK